MRLRGKPNRYGFQVETYDLGEATETADFAPVYPASEALAQKQLRALVRRALGSCAPRATRCRPGSRPRSGCRSGPTRSSRSTGRARSTRRRAVAGGSRSTSCSSSSSRSPAARPSARQLVAEALPAAGELLQRYRAVLPFTLTDAQERAIAEIDGDLARTTPMQRLLQGDVGSGKTVVALYALLRAVEAGRQGALMAPTETLAEQHFLTIEGICAELGVRVALLTSALTAKEPRTSAS